MKRPLNALASQPPSAKPLSNPRLSEFGVTEIGPLHIFHL